jgi:hypothetical protein
MKAVQHDLIKLRAYEIWERGGYPGGLDKEHWEQAEKELLDAAPEVEASVAVEPSTDAGAADRDSSEVKAAPVPNRSGARNSGEQSPETVKPA